MVKTRMGSAAGGAVGESTREDDELRRAVADLGVSMEPVFPNADDPEMASYFSIPVETREEADRIVERLQSAEAVEAVYVKPTDAYS